VFVDPSHIVRLECLPSGIWGTADVWRRILTHKGHGERMTAEGNLLRSRFATVFRAREEVSHDSVEAYL
jgi:hypothetical protein